MTQQFDLLDLFSNSFEESEINGARKFSNTDSVVLAIVIKHNSVLMIRREIENMSCKWLFPGGKIEIGESAFEAAAREVHEETGIFCKPSFNLQTKIHPITKKKIHYIVCDYKSNSRSNNGEYKSRWFSINRLPNNVKDLISNKITDFLRKTRKKSIVSQRKSVFGSRNDHPGDVNQYSLH